MFPISVISHQTVIPPNSPDYVEHFDKIELPNREEYDLRITTVNVSVDTTALPQAIASITALLQPSLLVGSLLWNQDIILCHH